MLLAAGGQFFFIGGIVALVAWLSHRARQRQNARWAATAAREGLNFTPGAFMTAPRMDGLRGPVGVLVTTIARSAGKSSIPYTVVTLQCPVALPPGLQITREGAGDALAKLFGGQDIELGDPLLDPKLRIKGLDPEAVREVLAWPAVRERLYVLLQASQHSRVEAGRIILEEQGNKDLQLERNLAEGAALAEALAEAVQAPWAALAARTGLVLEGSGGGVDLRGEIDGLRVEARAQVGRGDAGPQTVVRITLPEGLPRMGISLSERGGESGGLRLGDPVLDGLVKVEARDDQAARALLTGPVAQAADLHGKLLAVIHGRPGSVLSGRELRVLGPGATADHVGALIDEGLALARALVEVAGLSPVAEAPRAPQATDRPDPLAAAAARLRMRS